MSDRTVTVRPAGGDYTSLNAAIVAEVAANANLTSDNGSGSAGILFFKYESDWSGGGDTTIANLNGFTTDSSYYPHIYTDSANRASSGGLDASKVILDIDTNGFNNSALKIDDQNAVVDGLQFRYSSFRNGATTYGAIVIGGMFNPGVTISNCYFERGAVGSGANLSAVLNDAVRSNNIEVRNCISNGFEGGFVESETSAAGGPFATFYSNCLAYGATDGFFTDSVNNVTFQNCVSFVNTTDFNDSGTGTMTVNFCASDDNTGTNNVAESGGGANWPNDFNAAGSGDFDKVSGSNLIGAGTDLSGVFTDDINGNVRSAWDVSADEFQAGGTQHTATLNDSYDFADQVDTITKYVPKLNDSYDFSDSLSVIDRAVIALSDSYDFGVAALGAGQFQITLNDEYDFGDQITGILQFVVAIIDEYDFADGATPTAQFSIVLNESYNFDDTVSEIFKYVEAIVDEYDFGDTQTSVLVSGGQGVAWVKVSVGLATLVVTVRAADMTAEVNIADITGRAN